MWCNEYWIIRRDKHLPPSPGYSPGDTIQDAIGQLCCQGAAVCQHPQGLYHRAVSPSPSVLSLYPCQRLLLPRCKTWHFSLLSIFKFSIAHFSCFLAIADYQPLSISPGHSLQHCVTCERAKSASHCLLQSLVRQVLTQIPGTPRTVQTLNHHPLTLTTQLVFLFT